MTPRDERSQDVVDNCNFLLEQLSGCPQTDSTPEGRMISQLKWLREKVETDGSSLPVDPVYVSTLRHVYTEGNLSRLANSQEDYLQRWATPMKRLIKLSYKGEYLVKRSFYPYVDRCITKLTTLIKNAPRSLNTEERGSISELGQVQARIIQGNLELPLMSWRDYPCFRKVYSFVGSTIDDLPGGKETSRLVADLVFEGVRPASWSTPEAADVQTADYL